MPARVDFLDYLPRLPRILTGGDVLGRGHKIQKVMRRAEAFRSGRLGRADFKFAIHRDRIAVNYLAVEALGHG
jgi:hypothetical protein